MNGHEAVVRLLLATASVDPHAEDNQGRAPLSWAENDHEAAMKLLVTTGVDPHAKDNRARVPLSWAAEKGS